MRITIIGHAGSGKSTLARKISKKLNIPHLHIDEFWFEAGGNKLKRGDTEGWERVRKHIEEKVIDFIKQDSWVSDGWYSRVQPIITEKADQIFFLDIPLYRRIFNHLKRTHGANRNKELTKWEDYKFIYTIIRRTFEANSKIKQFIHDHNDKVRIFRKYKEIEEYLNTL
jgi:adenylate kinase family enzyme